MSGAAEPAKKGWNWMTVGRTAAATAIHATTVTLLTLIVQVNMLLPPLTIHGGFTLCVRV